MSFKLFFTRWLFKRRLKKGHLIYVDNKHRGIGKTTMLVNLSIKNKIPIIVGSQQDWGNLKYMNHNLDLVRLAKNFTFEVKGREFPNGVLVEESVEPEMIEWLKEHNIKIRGGFVANYGSDK
jgi:hypothetical protein